jgi:hypothetical protein
VALKFIDDLALTQKMPLAVTDVALNAKMARDILETFEMTQSAHLNDRAHLLLALREIT